MIHCPKCGTPTKIVHTNGNERIRKCAENHRFTTLETIVDEPRDTRTYVRRRNNPTAKPKKIAEQAISHSKSSWCSAILETTEGVSND